MNVDEYRHTSFNGPDCEYLDGEVVERNVGEIPHRRIQAEFAHLLMQMEAALGIQAMIAIRIPITARRFRVADVAVWRGGNIGDRIPHVPSFLVIEILSPEDRFTRMHPKIQEYLGIGTEWIWRVDPEERKAISYSQSNPAGTLCEVLRTVNPGIETPLGAVWEALN